MSVHFLNSERRNLRVPEAVTVTVVVGAGWLLPPGAPGVPGVPGAPGAPGAPGVDVGCAVVVVVCVVVCVGVEDVVGDVGQPHPSWVFMARVAVAVAAPAAPPLIGPSPKRPRRSTLSVAAADAAAAALALRASTWLRRWIWALPVAAAAPVTKMSCRKRRSTLFEAGWSNWAAGSAPMRGRAAAKIRDTTDTETFIVGLSFEVFREAK